MTETIYIIAKIWQGGRFELIRAYKDEEQARTAAAKEIPMNNEGYAIVMYTVLAA